MTSGAVKADRPKGQYIAFSIPHGSVGYCWYPGCTSAIHINVIGLLYKNSYISDEIRKEEKRQNTQKIKQKYTNILYRKKEQKTLVRYKRFVVFSI